jgi:hypothetical protein
MRWISRSCWAGLVLANSSHASVISGPVTNPANGATYYLLAQESWTASEAEAESLGGHLATVNDAAEQTWIMNNFGSSRNLWIGLYDPTQDALGGAHVNNFVWADGEPVAYTNWNPLQPDNSPGAPGYTGEYYVMMWGNNADIALDKNRLPRGSWNDIIDSGVYTNPSIHVSGSFGVVEIPGTRDAVWNGAVANWSVPANWSTSPDYPQNGAPGGTTYTVTINSGTVTLDVDVQVNSLTIAATKVGYLATLDLSNHLFVVSASDATDKAAKLAQLQAALAGGNRGILSSTTSADTLHKTTVVVDNGALGLTQFAGQAVNANSLLLESTWLGDSNLDRKVDVTDLGTLATHYGQSTTLGILAGDFNNDGKVDVTDLGLLATNYGQGTNGAPFNASGAPEPASIAMLAIGNLSLLLRPPKTRSKAK